MSDNKFDIIFTGDIVDGADISTVKIKAAQLFRLDEAKLAILFRGKRTALKKNVDNDTAQKYQKILKNIGMITVLQSHGTTNASLAPQKSSHDQAAISSQAPSIESSTPIKSSTPIENPAPIESPTPKFSEPNPSSTNQLEVLPVGELVLPDNSAVLVNADQLLDGVDWTIDQPGAQLSDKQLSEQAEAAVNVLTVPDLSIAPPATDLLSDDEKAPTVPPLEFSTIEIIDTAEVGEDLLPEAEKTPWVERSVDISHLKAEQPQGDLLSEHEKNVVDKQVIDISNIQLVDDK